MPDGELVAFQSGLIEVRRTHQGARGGRGGRGVFARSDIAAGTLIERAPVLVVPADQIVGGDESPFGCPWLTWYVFDWREVDAAETRDVVALALGYASLYNHDWPANARWERLAPDVMEITAHRDIAAGAEITINYHGEPDDPSPVTFPDVPNDP